MTFNDFFNPYSIFFTGETVLYTADEFDNEYQDNQDHFEEEPHVAELGYN